MRKALAPASHSPTVEPSTWLTAKPAGSASVTSRASPCTTSTRTDAVTTDVSSPSSTSSAIRPRMRSGCCARRSSTFRFHDSVSGWPGRPNTTNRLSLASSLRSAT